MKTTIHTIDGVALIGEWTLPAGATTAALLLHMMPATRQSWRGLVQALSAANIASLAIDLRGHGESVLKPTPGSDEPVTCKLYRAELADDEPLVILTVACTSTAKEVFLRVPPDLKDAARARDWTFGSSLAEAFET